MKILLRSYVMGFEEGPDYAMVELTTDVVKCIIDLCKKTKPNTVEPAFHQIQYVNAMCLWLNHCDELEVLEEKYPDLFVKQLNELGYLYLPDDFEVKENDIKQMEMSVICITNPIGNKEWCITWQAIVKNTAIQVETSPIPYTLINKVATSLKLK